MAEYAHHPRTHYDYETIHTIVNAASVLHVSFPSPDPQDPFPALLPMIGVMGSYPDATAPLSSPMTCYLHGYISSRLMKLAGTQSEEENKDKKENQEKEEQPHPGLPVSIAATLVDGIVLALTPFHHSLNYRSAILHGHAHPITATDEKLWAMTLLTNHIVPERWENSRVPPDSSELTSTQILKVEIESASAKVREGGPKDERKDMRNEGVRERVWVGVVPLYESVGEPVAADYNLVGKVPGYLDGFVKGENEWRRGKGGQ